MMSESQAEGAQDFVNDAVSQAQADMLSDIIGLIGEMIAELQETKDEAGIEVLQDLEDRIRARWEL